MKNKFDDYIKESKRDIIKDILQFIQIKSITGDNTENKKALDLFLEKAEKMGMKTMRTSTGDVGVVEIGVGVEIVGVLVHMDVVGVGDTDKWTYPPFEGKLAKGFIWGRGAVDDKGPAVMCLYSLKTILDLKIPLNKRIWLIVGTSEEREWTDIENFKKEFTLPNYGFSPDGDFPIYNRGLGYCDVEMDFFEPCRNMLEEIEAGDSVNTIPSKAIIKIKNKEKMIFHGISCHSSMPGLGVNAISKMAIDLSYRTEFNFLRFLNDFLAKDYNGKKLNISQEKDNDSLPMETTIAVPTTISITENGVKLNINLRLWFGVTRKKIEEAFIKFEKDYNYSFKLVDYIEPLEVDQNEEFLAQMNEVYEEYGLTGGFQTSIGTSYAKSMDHIVNWGPVFDTEPSCAHMEDERLSIEAMVTATQMYTTYLARTASAYGEIRKSIDKKTSLEKALVIFKLFTTPPYVYDIKNLVDVTGMNRTTVYRNLSILEKMGFLVKNNNNKEYRIGPFAKEMYEAYEIQIIKQ